MGMCPWGKCPGGTCPGGFIPVIMPKCLFSGSVHTGST